jgi:hypothetical protein
MPLPEIQEVLLEFIKERVETWPMLPRNLDKRSHSPDQALLSDRFPRAP